MARPVLPVPMPAAAVAAAPPAPADQAAQAPNLKVYTWPVLLFYLANESVSFCRFSRRAGYWQRRKLGSVFDSRSTTMCIFAGETV